MASALMLRRFSTPDPHVNSPPPANKLHRQSSCNPNLAASRQEAGQSPTAHARSSSSGAPWINLFKRLRSGSGRRSSKREKAHKDKSPTSPVDSRDAMIGMTSPGSRRNTETEYSDKLVKNIYRRPSTRSKGKSGQKTNCDKRRHQFSQCHDTDMWSSVPDEMLGMMGNDAGQDSPDTEIVPSDNEQVPRRQGSILRRPRSQSVPAVQRSHKSRSGRAQEKSPLGRTVSSKQTSFNEDVEVIYYEEEATPISNLCFQSEKLKYGSPVHVCATRQCPDDMCDINRNCLEGVHGPVYKPKHDACPRSSSDNTESHGLGDNAGDSMLQACALSGIYSKADSRHRMGMRKGIRLKIEIDDSCLKSRTSVKAMSGGTSLIVVTYRNVASRYSESQDIHQYVEKINLPVTIDPYSVKAQVKKSGILVIEAPLREESTHDRPP